MRIRKTVTKKTTGTKTTSAEKACTTISKILAGGAWVTSRDLHAKAAKAGISDSMIGRAKKQLGVELKRDKDANGKSV
jgi:hypothetical protein